MANSALSTAWASRQPVSDLRSGLHNAASAGGGFSLQLLGGFDLLVDDEPIEVPEGAQRLIAFLALHRRSQTRLCIAGNLWPEKSDGRATANLRSTLWRAHLADGRSVLHTKGPMIGIQPSTRLDVRELEIMRPDTILRLFAATGATSYERLFDELLPGWYDDWVIVERERFAQLQLRLAESLARAVAEMGDEVTTVDLAYRTMALDPIGYTRDRILRFIP